MLDMFQMKWALYTLVKCLFQDMHAYQFFLLKSVHIWQTQNKNKLVRFETRGVHSCCRHIRPTRSCHNNVNGVAESWPAVNLSLEIIKRVQTQRGVQSSARRPAAFFSTSPQGVCCMKPGFNVRGSAAIWGMQYVNIVRISRTIVQSHL